MSLEKAESRLKGSKVLITGHTGFTGTWAQLWLDEVGAECIGLSFENHDEYSMRKSTKLKPTTEFIGDVADSTFVLNTFERSKDDLVGVLELGVSYPAYDFMYSTYIFDLPFGVAVSDILTNRRLDVSNNYQILISSNPAVLTKYPSCLKLQARDYAVYDAMCIGAKTK